MGIAAIAVKGRSYTEGVADHCFVVAGNRPKGGAFRQRTFREDMGLE